LHELTQCCYPSIQGSTGYLAKDLRSSAMSSHVS